MSLTVRMTDIRKLTAEIHRAAISILSTPKLMSYFLERR